MKVHAAIPLQKKAIAILGHMHRDTGSNNSVLDSLWQDCHCSATCCLRPITQKKKKSKKPPVFNQKSKTWVGQRGTTGDDTWHVEWIKASLAPTLCPTLCWPGQPSHRLLSPVCPCLVHSRSYPLKSQTLHSTLYLLVSYINFHNKPRKELDFRALRSVDLQARSALTAQEWKRRRWRAP